MDAPILKINCSEDFAERVMDKFHKGQQILIGVNDRGEYAVEQYYPEKNFIRMLSMQKDGRLRINEWHSDEWNGDWTSEEYFEGGITYRPFE